MNDELDTRIRAMLSAAVQDTPPAPDLPRPSAAGVRLRRPRRSLVWAGAALAAAAAAITTVVLVRDSDPRVAPADGTTSTTTTPTEAAWPDGVRVVVAGAGGVAAVESQNGSPVIRTVSDRATTLAIELENGDLVYQDASSDDIIQQHSTGGESTLVEGDGTHNTSLEDARLDRSGEVLVAYRTVDAGVRLLWLGGGALSPRNVGLPPSEMVGLGRFTFVGETSLMAAASDDVGERYLDIFDVATGTEQRYPLDAVAGAGQPDSSFAAVLADGTMVTAGPRAGFSAPVAGPEDISGLDTSGDWLVVQYRSRPGLLVNLRTGARFDLPAAEGRLTLLRRFPAGEPSPDTTVVDTTSGLATTEPATQVNWTALTAGADGVREVTADGETMWTTEPMTTAVKAPDGSVIVQRAAGVGSDARWGAADTVPLRIAAPGATPVSLFELLLPAADPVAGYYTVHDAAIVAGRSLLLLDRQYDQTQGVESPRGVLLTMDLDTGEIVTVRDGFGGWESGSGRLRLGTSGLVVGEYFASASASFFAVNVLDEIAAPTATDFGLQPSYDDCGVLCPHAFTVRADGAAVAWLDGTTLRIATAGPSAEEQFDLGEAATNATGLSLGDGFVVLTYGYAGQPDRAPAVVVPLTTTDAITLPGTAAVAVA